MARPLRIEYPGAVYHITSRGNARNAIYSDDCDREIFLRVLGAVVRRYRWLCHAYCLMDNHYHLLIETPEANLSIGMRQLNGVYTQTYNRSHRTLGHLFQGRFKAILVQKETYLLELCRYVVLNPVRARLVDRPEDWRWSSYRATTGITKAPDYLTVDWIHALFGKTKRTAQARYRAFVREGVQRGSPWDKLQGQVLLGEEAFIERFKNALVDKEEVKEIPRQQRHVTRPPLVKLFTEGKTQALRDEKIFLAHAQYGYTLKEIADHLGIHYTTASKAYKRMAPNEK